MALARLVARPPVVLATANVAAEELVQVYDPLLPVAVPHVKAPVSDEV